MLTGVRIRTLQNEEGTLLCVPSTFADTHTAAAGGGIPPPASELASEQPHDALLHVTDQQEGVRICGLFAAYLRPICGLFAAYLKACIFAAYLRPICGLFKSLRPI